LSPFWQDICQKKSGRKSTGSDSKVGGCPEPIDLLWAGGAGAHPEICVHCGYKGMLGRVFNIPGITFRGSGFYHTDKALDEITDPEYQLTHEEQIEYYDEKLKDGLDVKTRIFT
jgi:hypothetical protein